MLIKPFKQIVSIILLFTLVNLQSNDIYSFKQIQSDYLPHCQTQYLTKKLALSSIFPKDEITGQEETINQSVGFIIRLYSSGQINDAAVDSLIKYLENSARLNVATRTRLEFEAKNKRKNKFLEISARILFAIHYPNLGEIKSVSVLEGGRDDIKPVKIETMDGKKYVWKPINNIRKRKGNKKHADFIVAFNLHLAQKGIPVSKFLKNKDNSYLVEVNGIYFGIVEYIEKGTVISGKDYSDIQHMNRGKLAAEIQNAVIDFENPVSDEDVKADYYNPDNLDNILRNIERSVSQSKVPISVDVKKQAELFKANFPRLRRHLAMSYIHSDLNPGNILFDGDDVSGLIDFSCSCYYYRICEFVRISLGGSNASMQTSYNKETLKQAISAFQQKADIPLSEEEIRGIIEFIRFEFLGMCQSAGARKFFVNESFLRFSEDFSDETKIQSFVDDIFAETATPFFDKQFSSMKGLKSYCESYKKRLEISGRTTSSMGCFSKKTKYEKILKTQSKAMDAVIREIKNGINPTEYPTSDAFLARVKFIYPEYRTANLSSEARRAHTDSVIRMYHAFVTGNFKEIYEHLPAAEKLKVSFDEYSKKLSEAKAKYDSLPIETKKILQEATIFHDYGYEYAAKARVIFTPFSGQCFTKKIKY